MMQPQVHRAVGAYLAAAATPVTLAIQKCLAEGRLGDLLKMKVNPCDYTNAEQYLFDAQALALFSKRTDLDAGVDTKAVALTNWWEAEHRCARTNVFLKRVESGPHSPTTLRFGDFLSKVKKRVSWWLGPVPESLSGRFGPGVTICCRGTLATVPDKISVIPTTTSQMLPYLHWWEESAWARSLNKRGLLYQDGMLRVTKVRASVWSSVRKNAKTDRSIEIGPSLNVFHQLDVGKTMKRRFRHRGWDLLNSAHLHRQVACEASITGLKATIDLKQASDSVAKQLVKLCVPPEWYQLLSDLRVPAITLPGDKVVYLEKFSGMGNGFTFELESVLFMAICQEVLADMGLPHTANTDVYVFGDDIIVPTEAAQNVINALRCLGFETNEDKTFISGSFRESCGGDFFNGVAVRPFYLEKEPNEPTDLIVFANGLRRVAESHPDGFLSRDYLRIPWLRVLDAIPCDIRRCRGPAILGDIVIHDDETRWFKKTRRSVRYFRVWRPVGRRTPQRLGGTIVAWSEFDESAMLAARLLSRNRRDGVILRGSVEGHKLGWVSYS